jgi:hypothetical protein
MRFFRIFTALFILGLLFPAGMLSARAREGSDPFVLPQVGLWFGPVTTVGDSWGVVDPALAIGSYFRYNLPSSPVKIGIETSYEKHTSKGTNKIMFIPVYTNLLYKLPIRSIMSYQLKCGAGMGYLGIWPEEKSQWDPLFTLGGEFSFPAGTIANIGLRVDYMLLYEKYIAGAKHNGHFVNVGVNLNFNISLFD